MKSKLKPWIMPFWCRPTMSFRLRIRNVQCCSNEKKDSKRRDDFVSFKFLHLCLLSFVNKRYTTLKTTAYRVRFEFIVIYTCSYTCINVYSGNSIARQSPPPPPFPLNFAKTMCYFDTDFTWKIPSKITLHWAVTNK